MLCLGYVKHIIHGKALPESTADVTYHKTSEHRFCLLWCWL